MRNLIIGVFAAVVLLLVAFFILNSYIYNEKQADSGEPSASLHGRVWEWVVVEYPNAESLTPREPDVFKLIFDEKGSFSATTDCNSVGGSYSASEGAISFSDVYLTKMFCEGSQEGEFVDVLQAAEAYTFTEEGALVLVLAEDGGRATFR